VHFAHVVVHRDGDSLVVTDESLPRVVAVSLADWTCGMLSHFFCGGASWPYYVGVGRWDAVDKQPYNLGNQLFVFGQWWGRKLLDNRRFTVLTLPITAEQISQLGFEPIEDEDDLD
jgi:hypothetical protein